MKRPFDRKTSGGKRGGTGFGGGKSFGGGKPWERGGSRGGSFGRSSDRPSMHPATCSTCGKPCEVPFIPTGSRPIFCSHCFKRDEYASPKESYGRGARSAEHGASGGANMGEELKKVNAKLDAILEILEAIEE